MSQTCFHPIKPDMKIRVSAQSRPVQALTSAPGLPVWANRSRHNVLAASADVFFFRGMAVKASGEQAGRRGAGGLHLIAFSY